MQLLTLVNLIMDAEEDADADTIKNANRYSDYETGGKA